MPFRPMKHGVCVVWRCGWVNTWEYKREVVHTDVRGWTWASQQDSAHPVLITALKAFSRCHLTHKQLTGNLFQVIVWATIKSIQPMPFKMSLTLLQTGITDKKLTSYVKCPLHEEETASLLRVTVISTKKQEIKTNFVDHSLLSALNLNKEDRGKPEKWKEKKVGFGLWFYYKGKFNTQADLDTHTRPSSPGKSSAIEDQIRVLHSWITFHRISAFPITKNTS